MPCQYKIIFFSTTEFGSGSNLRKSLNYAVDLHVFPEVSSFKDTCILLNYVVPGALPISQHINLETSIILFKIESLITSGQENFSRTYVITYKVFMSLESHVL